MRKGLPRHFIAEAVLSAAFVGCSPSAPPAPTTPPAISAERAKQLAVDRFNETLAGRYHMKNPRTGGCGALPEIGLEHIDSAKFAGDSWLVERNPLIGVAFSIRVARNGNWAAVEKLEASVE